MRYYKIVENGYIPMIGTGLGGEEISELEYNSIMEVIRNRLTPQEGKDYKLKTDLTWEEYDLPTVEQIEPTVSPDYLEGYDQVESEAIDE